MLAVTTSDIEPLPHQLRAVYGELLERRPLRFLLADDPGAGTTITAGLYIKELILREDVKRCLVVVPGGLVDQWQDELYLKFGLAFEILTPQFSETVFGASAFEQHPLLIPRMGLNATGWPSLTTAGRRAGRPCEGGGARGAMSTSDGSTISAMPPQQRAGMKSILWGGRASRGGSVSSTRRPGAAGMRTIASRGSVPDTERALARSDGHRARRTPAPRR